MMKLKSKKKKTPAFALDFVTARSLSECDTRLKVLGTLPDYTMTQGDLPDEYIISQKVRLGLFLRLESGGEGGYYTVSHAITLRPVEHGTYVAGTLQTSTRRRIRLEQRIGYSTAGAWLFLWFVIVGIHPLLLIFAVQSLFWVGLFQCRRFLIVKRAQELSRQVSERLYVPPDDPPSSSQPV